MTLFSSFFDGHQQNRKSPKVPFLLINNDFEAYRDALQKLYSSVRFRSPPPISFSFFQIRNFKFPPKKIDIA